MPLRPTAPSGTGSAWRVAPSPRLILRKKSTDAGVNMDDISAL